MISVSSMNFFICSINCLMFYVATASPHSKLCFVPKNRWFLKQKSSTFVGCLTWILQKNPIRWKCRNFKVAILSNVFKSGSTSIRKIALRRLISYQNTDLFSCLPITTITYPNSKDCVLDASIEEIHQSQTANFLLHLGPKSAAMVSLIIAMISSASSVSRIMTIRNITSSCITNAR